MTAEVFLDANILLYVYLRTRFEEKSQRFEEFPSLTPSCWRLFL